MFAAGLQIVCVDPKGDWWGMRSSADGRSPGLSILILGGEHGDLPLEVGSGELVAKLVVEERVSVLLDLSLFRKSEVASFMTAFAENLYRLKAREVNRTPVMLFVDEADAVAPQKPQHGEERMLGAIEDIVRRGGQRGIGCTLVTQRSAVLNKNVLTQAQVMVAMRTIAPQDLKAMDAWIDVHGTPEQRKTLMESLPSLPRGDAWFWSPGWPTDEGIFRRVHVDPIETFDSGATPEPGARRVEPRKRADVDLEALRRQMAATIERAKAADPTALRRRVAELEAQLRKASAAAPAAPARERRVEVPILGERDLKRIDKVAEVLANSSAMVAALLMEVKERLRARATPPPAPRPAAPSPAAQTGNGTWRAPVAAARRARAAPSTEAGEEVSEYALSLVRTLASRAPMALTKSQLALLSNHSPTSGGYFAALAELRRLGAFDRDGSKYVLTDAGRQLVGAAVPVATSPEEVRANWRRSLPDYERALFDVLVEVYPHGLSKADLAERAGKSATSGGYFAALATLRRNEIMVRAADGFRASEDLFG